MFVTIKNSRDFDVPVTYTNAAGDEVETVLAPTATLDVSEEQKEAIEKQLEDAEKSAAEEEEEEQEEEQENGLEAALAKALNPLTQKIEKLEAEAKNAFDKSAKAPKFKKNGAEGRKEEVSAMSWQDRHAKQINAAWDLLKRGDQSAAQTLNDINQVNLNELKKEGIVQNSVTIADFGNFIISREMLTDIEGNRNDYTPLINATN